MDMDFELAFKVSRIAQRHARKATPIERAWPQVVQAAGASLGAALTRTALDLPITSSLACVSAQFAALLTRERPGRKIKALYFGLPEISLRPPRSPFRFTPYISGATGFSASDDGWASGPEWMPDDCFAPNPAMDRLSDLRPRFKGKSWLIETSLIEPLHTLLVGAFVSSAPPDLLLGDAPTRGIGCGLDEGDMNILGTIDKKGFTPIQRR